MDEHWIFVSYVAYLEDDPYPHFGNVCCPMNGHIGDEKGFVELEKAVITYAEDSVKQVNKKLKGTPVIINFKEL